jgi:hypothetical protein
MAGALIAVALVGLIVWANASDVEPTPTLETTSVPPPSGPDDPVVVAVGDIACDPADSDWDQGTATECGQVATSDLALSIDPDAVLILGDIQYECGGYDAFLTSYDPSWGRLKDITYPVPGNHEYNSASESEGAPTARQRPTPPGTTATSGRRPATRRRAGTASISAPGT